MRKFMYCCKDIETGHEMILSECTYNQAMSWLDEILAKHDMTCDCRKNDTTGFIDVHIWDKCGTPCRTFYYDEKRGYLLGQ